MRSEETIGCPARCPFLDPSREGAILGRLRPRKVHSAPRLRDHHATLAGPPGAQWARLVIAFLPRSKCILISFLQSPSAAVLEPKKIKSFTVSIVSPFIWHEVMGPDAMILVFEC